MSKKIWSKIFKSKTKNKISENKQKRCSVIYLEYQQQQHSAIKTDLYEHQAVDDTIHQNDCVNNAVIIKKCINSETEMPNTNLLIDVHCNKTVYGEGSTSGATYYNNLEQEIFNDIIQTNNNNDSKNSYNNIDNQRCIINRNDIAYDGNRPEPLSRLAKVVNSFTLKRSKSRKTQRQNNNKKKSSSIKDQNDSTIESTGENTPTLLDDTDVARTNLVLTPCPICSRTFNVTTFTKHVSICQKTATKRRKVFDSSRQRREGTDLAAYPLPKGYGLPPQPNVLNEAKRDRSNSPNQSSVVKTSLNTRKNSESNTVPTSYNDIIRSTARSSMRANSKSLNSKNNANANDISTFQSERLRSSERINKKRSVAPQTDQCPYCDRCFGLKAFDRHVEWCKEKALQASIKNPSKIEPNAAMERLQARTNYRAPVRVRTKRSVNRDKYSGINGDQNETSIDGTKCKGETTTVTTTTNSNNKSGLTNKTDKSNSSHIIMSQSVTSSMHSESKKQIGEVIRYKAKEMSLDTKPDIMCLEGESKSSVNIVKTGTTNINDASTGDDQLKDLVKKNSKKKRDNKVEVVRTPSTWVNPDGSFDSELSVKGLQPRRNCRTKVNNILNKMKHNLTIKCEESETDLMVRNGNSNNMQSATQSSTEHILRAYNSSSMLNLRSIVTPIQEHISKTQFALAIGASNQPKRIFTQQSTINEPMKALPLHPPPYGKMINPNTDMVIDANKTVTPTTILQKTLKRSLSYTVISEGLHADKYDPFLLAKRQLEELCAPTEKDSGIPMLPSLTKSFSTNNYKNNNNIDNNNNNSKPTSASTPTTPAMPKRVMTMSLNYNSTSHINGGSMHQNTRPSIPKTPSSVANSFRRTSSLRGPQRSPLLNTRPLFVHNYRPTIQRGLSDEGPISTNFLKPEEYDEMPVRSVCVNDFALTKSPRVKRRDVNTTLNRKQNLKINIQAKNNMNTTPGVKTIQDTKELSKTDSLAVFLKYEKELERELTTKLEKIQHNNSMRSCAADNQLHDDMKNDSNQIKDLLYSPTEENGEVFSNLTQEKADIINKEQTNDVKPLEQQSVINLNVILNQKQPSQQTQSHPQSNPQNINTSETYKLASSTENIDPKLINQFDNLLLKSKTHEHQEPQLYDSDVNNYTKYFLEPKKNNHYIKRTPSPPPRKLQHAESNISNNNHNNRNHQYLNSLLKNTYLTNIAENSTSGYSLLKRKIRLDRNQFLYDDISGSSNDEKIDFGHKSQLQKDFLNPTTTPSLKMPIMPALDDFNFDFEEFLSSFQHDDEQFPLFKDCKEFLSNRMTNKQRAPIISHNTPILASSIENAKYSQTNNNDVFFASHHSRECNKLENNKNDNRIENTNANGEIFISIEAEQSDSGKSPISPASLLNMVGNSKTVVEVHEVGAINDTKFSKISNDDYDNNNCMGDGVSLKRPNVKNNNAKNLTQKRQQHQLQKSSKNNIKPSGDANEDSDDINSSSTITTARPIRRTSNLKTNTDSAQCSLPRKRSTELPTPLPRVSVRPSTAGNLPVTPSAAVGQLPNVQQQQFCKTTKGPKTRSNLCVFEDVFWSSSSSETSLPPIDFHPKNYNMKHTTSNKKNNNNSNNIKSDTIEQHLFTSYGKKLGIHSDSQSQCSVIRRSLNSRINESSMETTKNNRSHKINVMGMVDQNEIDNHCIDANSNSMLSVSNINMETSAMNSDTTSSNPSVTSSAFKKMSKFCHECGSKFIIDQAKFCMDCGVKRIIL